MKKSTSVILSVLMVISLFGCLFTGTTVTAESTAANLIVNGDFESFDVNTEHNNTALPGLDNRSVNSVFPTDKTKGQWYRSGGGLSPLAAPDLKEDYKIYNPTEDKEYPTYFGANNQRVLEPGSDTNHVLRAVQDLYTQVEPKDNGEYALTFRFKLPNNDTGLSYFDLFFVSPKLNSENGQSIQNNLKYPFSITSAELGNKTTTGITATLAVKNDGYKYNFLRIKFDETNTDWQTVEVAIKTEKVTHENAKPDVYKVDETDYTSPVLVKIGFGTDGINLTDKITTDEPIANATSYRKKAIYFDDFVMNEVVNCIGDAEFYDVNGNPLPDEQAYTEVTTTVGGEATSTVCVGDEVTATVADYDTTSGAYRFLGWYKDGVKVGEGSSYTFTAAADETYTPHFGSANLLGSSGSFEGIAAGTHMRIDAPTTDNPNFPTGNKWGFNVNAGYWGKTWEQSVIGKDGTSYAQVSSGSIKTDFITNGNCNILDNAAIAKSGSKFLHLNHNAPVSLGLDNLEKGTDYALSFYLRYSGANANKIYAGAITTTVNISNATLSGDMNKSLENAIGATSHPIVVAKCDATALSNATSGGWSKITFNFNSGNFEKLYLAFRTASGAPTLDYYIDDMVLVAMSSANVQFMNTKGEDITAECANEAKPAITNSAKPGYLVANADYEDNAFDFKGWYNGDTLLSTDKSFEFPNGAYTTLTAKVVSRNILSSTASFEGYNVDGTEYKVNGSDTTKKPDYPSGNLWGANANKGYFNTTYKDIIYDNTGKAYQQTSGTTQNSTTIGHATVSDAQYKSGSKSLRIDFGWRAASLGIDVTPNTDYKLSYYYYTAAGQSIFEKVKQNQLKTAVVTTVNVGDSTTATAQDGSTIKVALTNALSDGSLIALGTATSEACTTVGGEWKKVDISFNSGNLSKVYLVVAFNAYNGKTETGEADNRALDGVWIDNLTCYATNLTADDLGPEITKYTASNIRSASSEKAQALRHQFEIQKALITNGNSLYGELVEYGSVAIRTDYLGNRELVKGGVYNYNGKNRNAVTGVAYNKDEGINKIYIENENSIIFTAALTGIGKTSSGTNYNAFGNSYTVRNYVIFRDRNTGKETIVYGAKVEGCVFDVMNIIMTEGQTSTNPQVQNDYRVLNDIFNSDTDQKNAYEAWLANQ